MASREQAPSDTDTPLVFQDIERDGHYVQANGFRSTRRGTMSEEEDKVTDTHYEYLESLSGSIILRQVPQTRLADRPAFALKDGATPIQLREAAEWVTATCSRASVQFINDEGFLVRCGHTCENCQDDDAYYYQWVCGPALLTKDDDGELEIYGHAMLETYGWEVVGAWN